MRIDIATLFPEMCDSVLNTSVLGRGIKNGFIEIHTHNIRDYTADKHRNVDDKPYGGGTGLVMQAQPIYDCIQDIISQHEITPRIIYMSPQGEKLTQDKVHELASEQGLILLCGHYEGVDQRVIDLFIDEEISIGDYVLTGGELPAMVVADCVARYVDGVLSPESLVQESFSENLLEYPHYTRPVEYRGLRVPEVLRSGNHAEIDKWRREKSLEITRKNRPDLLK